MKTPEEIKKALKQCADYKAFGDCLGCPYHGEDDCAEVLELDALSYIEQLEARIAEQNRTIGSLPAMEYVEHLESEVVELTADVIGSREAPGPKRFIKLTTPSGDACYINLHLIESFGIITDGHSNSMKRRIGKTFLVPTGLPEDTMPYIVLESPETIMAYMDEVYEVHDGRQEGVIAK